MVPVRAALTGQLVLAPSAKVGELVGGQAGHGGAGGQVDAGDALAGLEGHVGLGVDGLDGVTGLGQLVGQRHREAGRVRRGDQLLGAGDAVGLLGAGRPADVVRPDPGGVERDAALALEQRALPVGVGGAGGGHARPSVRTSVGGRADRAALPTSDTMTDVDIPEAAPTFYDVGRRRGDVPAAGAPLLPGVADDPVLRPLYPEEDLTGAEDRLRMFLVQYWGGPRTYRSSAGHPRLRMRHVPFKVGPAERDAWLHHMRESVAELELPPSLEAPAVGLPRDGGAQHGQPVPDDGPLTGRPPTSGKI